MDRTDGRGTARDDYDVIAERYARDRATAGAVRAQRLRDEMIRAVLPLAGRLARRYRGRSEPLADLEQVARLGLVKAVDRYDPERGSFTAYAVNTVLGELKRHLRDRTWDVHVPRRMQELTLVITRHEIDLTAELGRRPTDGEMAQRSGMDGAELDHARLTRAGYCSVSLNMPIGDDGSQFGDLFGDPDESVEKAADHLTVAELMRSLPERERYVVVSVFYGSRTQADVAAELGVSQMHVSRILARALAWMREGLLTDRVPRRGLGANLQEDHFEVAARMRPSGVLEISVAGEVDRDNAERLRTALLDVIRRQPAGRRVRLDLGGVPLLDAAGVRVLLAVHEAARARRVEVTAAGLQPFVRQIAAAAGLTRMLAPDEPARRAGNATRPPPARRR